MEWVSDISNNESVTLVLLVIVLIGAFSAVVKKSYSNYLLRMKKIQALFANKQDKL
jgi:Tfp pilus assembly protein PilE